MLHNFMMRRLFGIDIKYKKNYDYDNFISKNFGIENLKINISPAM